MGSGCQRNAKLYFIVLIYGKAIFASPNAIFRPFYVSVKAGKSGIFARQPRFQVPFWERGYAHTVSCTMVFQAVKESPNFISSSFYGTALLIHSEVRHLSLPDL
ncbi:hypothetical protein CAAN1_14S00122 [[Candida] anglica]|uniref:Secreted protein n=1 Tax=[Candida] anglica TaxID=148631 RepID=A0ABP0EIZ9_9ASCO